MITLQQLSKRFGTQTAVDALSLEIPAGQIVGFLGPNGAGKSTTLKMLTGMLEPSSGTATVCGFGLCREPLEVKRRVGFVPESGAVFESLTGLEYLEMVAALYAIPEDAARARIRQFIAFFDLSFETLTDKLLGAYSKGMRRKVVITAALLHNPPVVFFDEPLNGLDANAAVGFKALIPCFGGKAVPLSVPSEEAKSAGRGMTLIAVMMVAMALSGLAMWAWSGGWFWWFVLGETLVAAGIYIVLSASLATVQWPSLE